MRVVELFGIPADGSRAVVLGVFDMDKPAERRAAGETLANRMEALRLSGFFVRPYRRSEGFNQAVVEQWEA